VSLGVMSFFASSISPLLPCAQYGLLRQPYMKKGLFNVSKPQNRLYQKCQNQKSPLSKVSKPEIAFIKSVKTEYSA